MKNKLFKKVIALTVCLAMLIPLCACGDTKEQKQVFAMDTVMTLTAYGKNAKSGLDAATGVINSLNTLLDPEVDDYIQCGISAKPRRRAECHRHPAGGGDTYHRTQGLQAVGRRT